LSFAIAFSACLSRSSSFLFSASSESSSLDSAIWIGLSLASWFASSKYPLAIPIANEQAETVARALHKYLFSVHGYPKILLSDRASGFVSKGLQWLCKHIGVAKIYTTGYLPTGAAPVERWHRHLNEALTGLCNRAGDDWDAHIDSILFAYRISVNETTGYTPYFMIHGREPRLPFPILAGIRDQILESNRYGFVEKITRAMQAANDYVRNRQQDMLLRNLTLQLGLPRGASRDRIDQKLAKYRDPGYEPGEAVSYWEPETKDRDVLNKMPKIMQQRYSGPHRVIGKKDNSYLIQRYGKQIEVPPGRLRRYYEWMGHPFEKNEEQERRDSVKPKSTPHVNPTEEPTPGQLVIALTRTTLDPSGSGK